MPKKSGFTLVELLVSISIIAILSAVAITAYSIVVKQGRDSKRQSDLRTLQSALEQYYRDQGFYPYAVRSSGAWGLNDLLSDPSRGAFTNQTGNPTSVTETITYLNNVPKDPRGNAYNYQWNRYQSSSCINCDNNSEKCVSYHVFTMLENPTSPTPSLPSSESSTCYSSFSYNFFVSPP